MLLLVEQRENPLHNAQWNQLSECSPAAVRNTLMPFSVVHNLLGAPYRRGCALSIFRRGGVGLSGKNNLRAPRLRLCPRGLSTA